LFWAFLSSIFSVATKIFLSRFCGPHQTRAEGNRDRFRCPNP
jgi:hypothetical protein